MNLINFYISEQIFKIQLNFLKLKIISIFNIIKMNLKFPKTITNNQNIKNNIQNSNSIMNSLNDKIIFNFSDFFEDYKNIDDFLNNYNITIKNTNMLYWNNFKLCNYNLDYLKDKISKELKEIINAEIKNFNISIEPQFIEVLNDKIICYDFSNKDNFYQEKDKFITYIKNKDFIEYITVLNINSEKNKDCLNKKIELIII